MIKRLFLGILLLLSICGIGYTFLQSGGQVKERADVTSAIPSDVIILFESDNVLHLWNSLKIGNVIWQELKVTEPVKQADGLGLKLDSALFYHADRAGVLDQNKLYCSLHENGGKLNKLWVLPLAKELSSGQMLDFYKEQIDEGAYFIQKSYEGVDILWADSVRLGFFIHAGHLVFSDSELLLEKSIRSISQGEGLALDEKFQSIRQMNGGSHPLYAYTNHQRLPTLLNTFRSSDGLTPFYENFADWGELDLNIRSNSLLLSGIVSADDSLASYLNVFNGQEELEMEVVELLPVNTADFVFVGISDPGLFSKNLGMYRHEIGTTSSVDRMWEETADYGVDEDVVLSSISGQILRGQFESDDSDGNRFCLISVHDEAPLLSTDLFEWTEEYRGQRKGECQSSAWVEAAFGGFFTNADYSWAAELGEYLLVADSERGLKKVIDAAVSGRNLGSDEDYQALKEDFSESSSLTYFVNLSRSAGIAMQTLSDQYSADVKERTETLHKFQAVCIQFEHASAELYHQSVLLKHNPVYKRETSSIWELALDTSFSNQLWVVEDYRNEHGQILVQDNRHDIHLISNTGKRLWRREIGQAIRSEIHQIDVYKNGKLQLLFNTEDDIYLIDRLGRDVEGYPIALPAKATTSLAVLDYEKNKKYRLLIGTSEGMLHNFNASGKSVKGWEYQMRGTPLKGDLQHFRIGSKDYISCIDEKGDLILLNRKGEVRHDAQQDLKDYNGGAYCIETKRNISETLIHYYDSKRQLLSQSMDAGIETKSFPPINGSPMLIQDGDRYQLEEGRLAYFAAGSREADYILLPENCDNLQLIDTRNGRLLVGSTANGDTYLMEENGTIIPGFPVSGSTKAFIQDMDGDGNSEFVMGDRDGVLYMYSLSL